MVMRFTCRNCRRRKAQNPRLKGKQRYCSEAPCQRARKAEWKRKKLATDGDYRTTHSESNQAWRESHRSYWSTYRKNHPEKVERNRVLQKIRRLKAKLRASGEVSVTPNSEPSVAKVDTFLPKELQGDSFFWIRPAVAKVDAFLVEISSISAPYDELQRSTRSPPTNQ